MSKDHDSVVSRAAAETSSSPSGRKHKARKLARRPARAADHQNGTKPLTSLSVCRIVNLPKIADPRGNLTFIEGGRHIPFSIQRVFYLYDVPGGADRAGHALKKCHQFLIAMSGSFDVVVYDGKEKERFHLNRSYYGLHVPPMIWREIDNFSSGSVCLAVASEPYDEKDYYRDYRDYLRTVGGSDS